MAVAPTVALRLVPVAPARRHRRGGALWPHLAGLPWRRLRSVGGAGDCQCINRPGLQSAPGGAGGNTRARL